MSVSCYRVAAVIVILAILSLSTGTHTQKGLLNTPTHTLAGELQAIVLRQYRTKLKHAVVSRVRTKLGTKQQEKEKTIAG